MSKKDETQKTLANGGITSARISRRSALGLIGASVAAAAALTGLGAGAPSRAEAKYDHDGHDGGSDHDGHDHGGCTDNDTGHHADAPGHGRHCRRPPPPRHSDPGGHGRSCSDADHHDHGGRGSHCSDRD